MKDMNQLLGNAMAFVEAFLEDYTPYKTYWNYEDGCVLKGASDLYDATENGNYAEFVLKYLETYVMPDGSIPNYESKKYNIDSINSGKALFFGYSQTGDERYRKAIEYHMQRLREHPRCACGNFFHKDLYPNQIWLDGLYMAQPFYMEYEMRYNKMENLGDIAQQFKNVRRWLYDEEKGLNYHAYDEAKEQFWADKETGCSPNFWLRSTGWYLMALIDCIDLCSEQIYEHYRALVDIFRESMRGLLRWQDKETGLFYQVIDRADVEGNYLETSGSAMAAYALLKAVRIGVMDEEKYLPIAKRIFEGLVEHQLVEREDGKLHLSGICAVAGLGPDNRRDRDGSVAYYLREPIVDDDSKGVGPFMMAFAEYLHAMRKKG